MRIIKTMIAIFMIFKEKSQYSHMYYSISGAGKLIRLCLPCNMQKITHGMDGPTNRQTDLTQATIPWPKDNMSVATPLPLSIISIFKHVVVNRKAIPKSLRVFF